MPLYDPEKLRIAQYAKPRKFYLCRRCGKKFRQTSKKGKAMFGVPSGVPKPKCPRCGSSDARKVHRIGTDKVRRKV